MRTFFLLVIAALVLTFVALQEAGSQKSPNPVAPPLPPGPGNPSALTSVPPPGSLQVGAPAPLSPKTEAQKLRERYLELAKKHGEILPEEALQAWLAQVETRVLEDQATHELNRVRETLKEIAKKYPGTAAGREARQMLGQVKPPTPDTPPIPDLPRISSEPERKKE